MWQSIAKLVLVPMIPSLVKQGLKYLTGSIENGIAWLEEQAAKSETQVDDQFVAVVKGLVQEGETGPVWEGIVAGVQWAYGMAKQAGSDIATKVVETVAKQLKITL